MTAQRRFCNGHQNKTGRRRQANNTVVHHAALQATAARCGARALAGSLATGDCVTCAGFIVTCRAHELSQKAFLHKTVTRPAACANAGALVRTAQPFKGALYTACKHVHLLSVKYECSLISRPHAYLCTPEMRFSTMQALIGCQYCSYKRSCTCHSMPRSGSTLCSAQPDALQKASRTAISIHDWLEIFASMNDTACKSIASARIAGTCTHTQTYVHPLTRLSWRNPGTHLAIQAQVCIGSRCFKKSAFVKLPTVLGCSELQSKFGHILLQAIIHQPDMQLILPG